MTKPLLHLIIALILLAAAAAVYVFWYLHVTGVREAAASLTLEAEAIDLEAQGISSARSALSKLAEDEQFFGSYFVSTSTVVGFLEELESTGDEMGSVVEVVSVTPSANERIVIALKAIGSFPAVMRTVGAIEYGPYDVVVISLSLDTTTSGAGTWAASGVVSVGTGAAKPASAPEATAPAEEEPLL